VDPGATGANPRSEETCLRLRRDKVEQGRQVRDMPSSLFGRLCGVGVGIRVAITVGVVLIQSCVIGEIHERDGRDSENTDGTAARVMHRSVTRMWLWI
jgi:hypothetical protein